jgi:proliferating cell nuclear antigen
MTQDTTTFTVGGAAAVPYRAALGQVADEYKIRFEQDGLRTRAIDPANVCLVQGRLDPGITGTYEDANPDNVPPMGMADRQFKKPLSAANKGRGDDYGSELAVEFDPERRRVSVGFEKSVADVTISHDYEWSAIDPDSMRSEATLPDLDLPGDAKVPRKAFVEALKRFSKGSDTEYVTFEIDGASLRMRCRGSDADVDLSIDGVAHVEPGHDNTVSSMYSSDFLKQMRVGVEAVKPENVRLELGERFPMKWNFARPDVGIELTYMLAPRVSAE